jgi:predicted transcriptional regulator
VTITTQIDEATHALVRRVAMSLGRSESDFLADAIQRTAESEADHLDFVQHGIDAIGEGAFVSQDEMERWFADRTARRMAG